jgi:hypothetical protein
MSSSSFGRSEGKHSSALAEAISRHRAAQAAADAAGDQATADASLFALLDLAETPCADTAELFEKLRYLLAHEKRLTGAFPWENRRPILIALERHLNALDFT